MTTDDLAPAGIVAVALVVSQLIFVGNDYEILIHPLLLVVTAAIAGAVMRTRPMRRGIAGAVLCAVAGGLIEWVRNSFGPRVIAIPIYVMVFALIGLAIGVAISSRRHSHAAAA